MKAKIQKLLIVIGVAMAALVGCDQNGTTGLEQEIATLKQQNETLQQENEQLKQKIQELEMKSEEPTEVGERTFTIYTADNVTLELEVLTDITIVGEATVIETLQVIAKKLSEEVFYELPIEVLKVEQVDGKQIATINLEEDETSEVKWNVNYFQGSTGATMTRLALVESFLQKEYDGEWIDGVLFLYENEPIVFDHLSLDEIVYE
jgi:hypothetical protein